MFTILYLFTPTLLAGQRQWIYERKAAGKGYRLGYAIVPMSYALTAMILLSVLYCVIHVLFHIETMSDLISLLTVDPQDGTGTVN